MNELQKQKAIEALSKQKEIERKKNHAMIYRLGAFAKLHYQGVMLPYKILYDLEKAEYEGTFKEVPPNPFYPNPAMTLKTKWSMPTYMGDYKGVTSGKDGLPNFQEDIEHKKKYEEYEQRVEVEKMPLDKWGYWYSRFLLPYDLSSFSDFDFWGSVPQDEEEKQIIDNLRAACMEAQTDCKEHPGDYNLEPIPRLEEHKAVYDVSYGYV